jgi:hypothetical protein
MNTLNAHAVGNAWVYPFAWLALAGICISLFALFSLHFLSPEFSPSWRMVSEYANGKYQAVLMIVFFAWAVGSWALFAALWANGMPSALGKAGLVFLVLAGVGQIMGGLFDINHKLHGPAAMIGIPSLCIAAVVITLALQKTHPHLATPIWVAHLPWISFVLMIIGFVLFFSSLKVAGIDVSAQNKPLSALPEGVTSFVGWANRIIFLSTYLWVSWVAFKIIQSDAVR